MVAERTVVLLREQAAAAGVLLKILPAMSFLDLAYVDLGIDPIAGLRIVDAHDFDALADAGKYPLMITQVYSQLVASDVKINLMEVLADEAQLYFLRNLGLPDEECLPLKLYELDRQPAYRSSYQCLYSGTGADCCAACQCFAGRKNAVF